jgi:hypothetical protein
MVQRSWFWLFPHLKLISGNFQSGKLIQKLFTRIQELAEREDWLIFVLIDEVIFNRLLI